MKLLDRDCMKCVFARYSYGNNPYKAVSDKIIFSPTHSQAHIVGGFSFHMYWAQADELLLECDLGWRSWNEAIS